MYFQYSGDSIIAQTIAGIQLWYTNKGILQQLNSKLYFQIEKILACFCDEVKIISINIQ